MFKKFIKIFFICSIIYILYTNDLLAINADQMDEEDGGDEGCWGD
jgi:hypothetical protein